MGKVGHTGDVRSVSEQTVKGLEQPVEGISEALASSWQPGLFLYRRSVIWDLNLRIRTLWWRL